MIRSGFEWASWSTYQPELYGIQAGLSATIATECIRLSHQLRSAFTNAEVAAAKQALGLVTDIQDRCVCSMLVFVRWPPLHFLHDSFWPTQASCCLERPAVVQ